MNGGASKSAKDAPLLSSCPAPFLSSRHSCCAYSPPASPSAPPPPPPATAARGDPALRGDSPEWNCSLPALVVRCKLVVDERGDASDLRGLPPAAAARGDVVMSPLNEYSGSSASSCTNSRVMKRQGTSAVFTAMSSMNTVAVSEDCEGALVAEYEANSESSSSMLGLRRVM